MGFREYVFKKILQPLFWQQIDECINKYRLAQVQKVEISDKGLVYVWVNKFYPLGTEITVFLPTKDLFDEDHKYLGMLEDVYARGKVIERTLYSSKILLLNQEKEVKIGLLAKVEGSKECAFTSCMEGVEHVHRKILSEIESSI